VQRGSKNAGNAGRLKYCAEDEWEKMLRGSKMVTA